MKFYIHQCIPGTPGSLGMVKFDKQNRVSALLLSMESAETRLWDQLGNDIGYVWDCAGASDSPGKVRFEKQNRVSTLLLNLKNTETRLWEQLGNDTGYVWDCAGTSDNPGNVRFEKQNRVSTRVLKMKKLRRDYGKNWATILGTTIGQWLSFKYFFCNNSMLHKHVHAFHVQQWQYKI